MFWLYFFVAVLLFGYGVYKLGVADINDDDKFGLFWVIGFIAVLWPLALALVVVVGPFVGLFLLGDRKRKQKEESSKNK